MKQHARFAQHLAFVGEHGLPAVVDLARVDDHGFTQDPRVGPWVTRASAPTPRSPRRTPAADPERYRRDGDRHGPAAVRPRHRAGAEPEDLLALDVPALIVPGQDDSHAPSAARYLQECLPRVEYWDVPVAEQTEETAPARILEFLDSVEAQQQAAG